MSQVTFFLGHYISVLIFSVLHCMQRSKLAVVKLSVHPSIKRLNYDKTKETYSPRSYTTMKDRSSYFLSWRMVGGGWSLLSEILGQSDPSSFKNADFVSI